MFSTLHTNSAVATITRLFDLGLKPYVVATALEGIIAQRLVRKICPDCRMPDTPSPELLARLGPRFTQTTFAAFKGKGCERCHGGGYSGRIGLYEVLAFNDKMRYLIADGASVMEIIKLAEEMDSSTLIEDGLDKVKRGMTTVEELLRVLGPQ